MKQFIANNLSSKVFVFTIFKARFKKKAFKLSSSITNKKYFKYYPINHWSILK